MVDQLTEKYYLKVINTLGEFPDSKCLNNLVENTNWFSFWGKGADPHFGEAAVYRCLTFLFGKWM